MMQIKPADDAAAAGWLLCADVDWWDLVRYGPPGFDAYVRIAFDPDGNQEHSRVRQALRMLSEHTSTPDHGYAAIWEGWGGQPNPTAPVVPIPHRTMLLFTGPVEILSDTPSLAWYGYPGQGAEPHLVWPRDQAWCLACEVDEEIEFTVGCSGAASQALAESLPGAVRRVYYGEPAPLYDESD